MNKKDLCLILITIVPLAVVVFCRLYFYEMNNVKKVSEDEARYWDYIGDRDD